LGQLDILEGLTIQNANTKVTLDKIEYVEKSAKPSEEHEPKGWCAALFSWLKFPFTKCLEGKSKIWGVNCLATLMGINLLKFFTDGHYAKGIVPTISRAMMNSQEVTDAGVAAVTVFNFLGIIERNKEYNSYLKELREHGQPVKGLKFTKWVLNGALMITFELLDITFHLPTWVQDDTYLGMRFTSHTAHKRSSELFFFGSIFTFLLEAAFRHRLASAAAAVRKGNPNACLWADGLRQKAVTAYKLITMAFVTIVGGRICQKIAVGRPMLLERDALKFGNEDPTPWLSDTSEPYLWIWNESKDKWNQIEPSDALVTQKLTLNTKEYTGSDKSIYSAWVFAEVIFGASVGWLMGMDTEGSNGIFKGLCDRLLCRRQPKDEQQSTTNEFDLFSSGKNESDLGIYLTDEEKEEHHVFSPAPGTSRSYEEVEEEEEEE